MAIAALMLWACADERRGSDVIFGCDEYTVYADSVVSGKYCARALNAGKIVSDFVAEYADSAESMAVDYRFSINGRDNEMSREKWHRVWVGGCDSTAVSVFGEPGESGSKDAYDYVGEHRRVTFRVDMRPMFRSFKDRGYYITPGGDTIYNDYFKGVWITGHTAPLRRDMAALHGDRGLMMRDRGDSIYQLTVDFGRDVALNYKDESVDRMQTQLPSVTSRQLLYDACSNIAMEHLDRTVESLLKDKHELRLSDVAMSVYLTLALTHPEESKTLLRHFAYHGRIVQDSQRGGAWPFSNDRLMWIAAAYEVYKATGDKDWLLEAIEVGQRTLNDDINVAYDSASGLIHGMPSSSSYWLRSMPDFARAVDLFESYSLRCNVIFAAALRSIKEMAALAGVEPIAAVRNTGAVADAVNGNLWIPQRRYYSDFLYGSPFFMQAGNTDNLGQALAVVFGVATPEMGAAIIKSTPRSVYGPALNVPVLTTDDYLSDGNVVFPSVQALWILASAKSHNMASVNAGVGGMLRSFALTRGNMRVNASTGLPVRRIKNAGERLVDYASMASITLRLLLGATMDSCGLRLAPCVPTTMPGEHHISTVRYRNAELDVFIHGAGDRVLSIKLDDRMLNNNTVPHDLEGRHTLKIMMANNSVNAGTVDFSCPVVFEPEAVVKWDDMRNGRIANYRPGDKYVVAINGVTQGEISRSDYTMPLGRGVEAADIRRLTRDKYPGFGSRRHYIIPRKAIVNIPSRLIGETGTELPVGEGRSGSYVELSPARNLKIDVKLRSNSNSRYFMDVKYANGSGEEDAQSRCVIRRVKVNGEYAGTLVLPCVGEGNWVNTAYSNMVEIKLRRGVNTLAIDFEAPYCMNGARSPGTALIENIRLIRR